MLPGGSRKGANKDVSGTPVGSSAMDVSGTPWRGVTAVALPCALASEANPTSDNVASEKRLRLSMVVRVRCLTESKFETPGVGNRERKNDYRRAYTLVLPAFVNATTSYASLVPPSIPGEPVTMPGTASPSSA